MSPASTVDPVPGAPESASAVVPPAVPAPVPGTPESASAVVPPAVPDSSPVTPVSASAVPSDVPVSPAPKPRKKKPRSSQPAVASSPAKSASVRQSKIPVLQSTPDQSAPVQSSPVAQSSPVRQLPSTPADQPTPPESTAHLSRSPQKRSFWAAIRRTGFGFATDDGTGATVFLDFGHLTRAVQCDATSPEFDRFVKYVHHGVGRTGTRPVNLVYLQPGTPLEFPKPPK